MTRKALVILIVLAVALAVMTVSIEAKRGGMRGSGDMGGSGGGITPVPDGNHDGNYDNGNYDPSSGNYDGNYDTSYVSGSNSGTGPTATATTTTTTTAVSPAMLWAKTYDGGGGDHAQGVAVDGSGNVYVTGYSYLGGNYDYYTIKYDSSGNVLWNLTYDNSYVRQIYYRKWSEDKAHGIAVDSSGDVYVTGGSWLDNYDEQYYTIKYDSSGNVLWNRTYDSRWYDEAYGIAVDGSGNVYVTGWSYWVNYPNEENEGEYLTVKYDSSDNVLWSRTYYGGTNDKPYAVAVDSSGNVYVTGWSSWIGSYYEGIYHYINIKLYDYYTIKYDSSGNVLWNRSYDSGRRDKAYDVAVDSSDNVYVTGNAGTIKYDSDGSLLWTESYGGRGVAIDSDDSVYVAGTSNSDYLTIKYDSNGNQLWNFVYDSGGDDVASGVAVDQDGSVIVTGTSNSDYLTIKYVMPSIPATVDIRPDTLDLNGHGMGRHGRLIAAYIELPEGYDVADINVSTVLLNGTILAKSHPSRIGDYDRDGSPDLMVKFDSSALKELRSCQPGEVELTVTGTLADGVPFEGSDTIDVIKRGRDNCEAGPPTTGQKALYVSGDEPGVVDQILSDSGFQVTRSATIPEDLSEYSVVVVGSYPAAYQATAGYLKDYIDNGGGVVLISGVPCYFSFSSPNDGSQCNVYLGGINDWFGALYYANQGGTSKTVADDSFGTGYLTGTVLHTGAGFAAAAIDSRYMASDSDIIAKWGAAT